MPEYQTSPLVDACVLCCVGLALALWSVGPLGLAGAAAGAPGAPRCAPRPFLAPQAVHFLQIPVPTLVFFSRKPPQRRDAGAPCMALVHRSRRRGGSSAAIMQRPSKFVCLTHPLAAVMDSVFDNAATQHMKLSVELCTGHVVQRRASDICRNQLSNG